jgi:hypothetical protein
MVMSSITSRRIACVCAGVLMAGSAVAATLYVVAGNPGATAPYDDWATAAADIQTAVTATSTGDTVLVGDGHYVLTAQISMTKGITVRSANGAAAATIDGNGATRCVYMNHPDAVLDGFTVQGGHNPGSFGGGVNIVTGGTVRNCVLRNNRARDGGGVAIDNAGLVVNCVIHDNLAADGGGSNGYGGGVRLLNGGTARGCLIVNNESRNYGGGVNIWNAGRVESCTIVANTAPNGAGIRTRNLGAVVNAILYDNIGLDWQVNGSGYSYTNCCTPNAAALPGSNNIADDPQFVDPASGDYRLQAGSPCINTGLNQDWMAGALDLDGHARVLEVTVDRGAYEVQPIAIFNITATAGANGAVSPDGVVEATQGTDQTFQLLPDPGYAVRNVLVDGVSVGAPESVTFPAVSANHTLAVTFMPASWRKADFIVEAVALDPKPTAPGQTFSAQVTIRNQGDIAGDAGALRVWTSLAAAAVPGQGGDASAAIGPLAAGESRVVPFGSLTAGAAGTHHVRAYVDADDITAEKSEGNNQKTATYTVQAGGSGGEDGRKADFVISEIYFVDVASPAPGEPFRLRVRVENKGDCAGDGGYVHFWAAPPYDLATAVLSIPVGELAPGAGITRSRVLTAPTAAGTYLARAVVVTDTPEKSTGNNHKLLTYTLQTGGGSDPNPVYPAWMKPDFVVDAVALSPKPTVPGQTFSAQVTIRNQGDLPGDAGALRVYLSQPLAATPATPGAAEQAAGMLAVGQTKTLTFSGLTAPTVAGTHHFRAFVDATAAAAEKSEGNNQKSATYTLPPAGAGAWDAGYQDVGGGWRRLAWFGDYVPLGGDWYWHVHFGPFSVSAASTPHMIFIFTTDMGWLFTGHTLYPYLFRFEDQTWLWYQRGSTNPRWFLNLQTGLWEQS